MASLSKTVKQGKTLFRIQFSFDGLRRTIYLGSVRESAANKIKGRIENLLSCAKFDLRAEDDTIAWVREFDWAIIQKLESWGVTKSVSQVVEERRRQLNPEADLACWTLKRFVDWYVGIRAGDCAEQTVAKIQASLNMLVEYCNEHESIETVDDVNGAVAFRFQLHRQQSKAEATVSKDVKVCKTAFSYGVRAGHVKGNPFANLKAGNDVNEDGQQIVPISDYELLINACPNSTWRAIIALARLGGLRCPSELTDLRWSDVNWEAGTIRVPSPKTKRYGKAERVIPLFERLDRELSDHWEATGGQSEFVIDLEHLRRRGVSLSTRFKKINESAGIPLIVNPMRNLRLSAANDVCRLPGITPKTITDWFGHDMKTALKHYHRTTRQDYEQALKVDPFANREIAKARPKCDAKSNARTPENGGEWGSRNRSAHKKSPVFRAPGSVADKPVTPTGFEPVLPP